MTDPSELPAADAEFLHHLQQHLTHQGIVFPEALGEDELATIREHATQVPSSDASLFYPQDHMHCFSSIKTYDSRVPGDGPDGANMRWYRMTCGAILRANSNIGTMTLQLLDQASTRASLGKCAFERSLHRVIQEQAVWWNQRVGPNGQLRLSEKALEVLSGMILEQTYGRECPLIHRVLWTAGPTRIVSEVSWREATEQAITTVAQDMFRRHPRFRMTFFRKFGAVLVDEYLIAHHGVSIYASLLSDREVKDQWPILPGLGRAFPFCADYINAHARKDDRRMDSDVVPLSLGNLKRVYLILAKYFQQTVVTDSNFSAPIPVVLDLPQEPITLIFAFLGVDWALQQATPPDERPNQGAAKLLRPQSRRRVA